MSSSSFAAFERLDVDEQLRVLAYELLDAHDDTVRLAGMRDDPQWQRHVHYLRDLQRVGRELIAQSAAGTAGA